MHEILQRLRGMQVSCQVPDDLAIAFYVSVIKDALSDGRQVILVLSSTKIEQVLDKLGRENIQKKDMRQLKFIDWYSWQTETVISVEHTDYGYRCARDPINLQIAINKILRAKKTERGTAIVELCDKAAEVFGAVDAHEMLSKFETKFKNREITGFYIYNKKENSEIMDRFKVKLEITKQEDYVRFELLDENAKQIFLYRYAGENFLPYEESKGEIEEAIAREHIELEKGESKHRFQFILCENCGAFVSENADKCSVCGAILSGVEKGVEQKEEISKEEEPVHPAIFICENCGAFVSEKAGKCEICGAILEKKETEEAERIESIPQEMTEFRESPYVCMQCGAFVPHDATICPVCGAQLSVPEKVPSGVLERVIESSLVLPSICPKCGAFVKQGERCPVCSDVGAHAIHAKVNGLINGVKERKIVGRDGLINGFVNGKVNGKKERPPRKVQREKVSIKKIAALFSVLLMLAVGIATLLLFTQYPGITIDGKFDDWNGVTMYENPVYNLENPSVEIARYAMHRYNDKLSFYVETRNTVMLGRAHNETDAFFMFVDADANASTGYALPGMGADYLAVFYGWDNGVKSASVYVWNTSRNQNDFNGFESSYSGKGACEGNRFEGQFTLLKGGEVHIAAFFAQDNYGNRSRGYAIISEKAGAVIATQSNPDYGAVNRTHDVELLALKLETMARANTLHALNITLRDATDFSSIVVYANGVMLGNASMEGNIAHCSFPQGVFLAERSVVNLTVVARISASAKTGTGIGARIADARDIWVENGTVTLYDAFISNTYIDAVPDKIVVDGAFGDWQNVMLNTDRANDTWPAGRFVWQSVDIARYGMVPSDNVSFYISTYGIVLAGEDIPQIIERPGEVPPQPPPPEVPVLNGMDAIFVFIDIDGNWRTGFRVYNNELGAEYMIKVTGRNNVINSSELWRYETWEVEQNWSKWIFVTNVSSALGSFEMECAIPKSILQDMGNRSVIRFATKNWLNAGDWSDTALVTNLLKETGMSVKNIYGTDVVINEIYTNGNNDWIEIVNPTENAIDISNWDIQVQNTVIYIFPQGTVLGPFGSGTEYLVVNFTNNPFPSNSRTVRIRDATDTRSDQTTYPANLGASQTWARYYSPYNGKPVDTDSVAHDFYVSSSPTQGGRNDRALPIDNHIVINEISVSPGNGWIEIANPTNNAVNIANWYLQAYIGGRWRTVYTFPAGTTIGAFGSGTEYRTCTPTSSLSTATGVRLYNAAGTLIDATTFSPIPSGSTWARYKNAYDGKPEDTDVNAWDFYLSATPTQGTWNDRRAPAIIPAKIADKDRITMPGEYINYTIYYNNTGDGRARNVWLNDTFSPYLDFISSTIAPSGYSGNTYYWNFTNLGTGNFNFTVTVCVNESIRPGTIVYNNVSVNYTDILGRKMPEGFVSHTITYATASIVAGKTVDIAYASPGDYLNYTVYYNNTGTANAKYVWINDTLPDYVTFVSSSIPPDSNDGRTYGWMLENITPGNHELTLSVRINTTAPTGITLTNFVTLNYTDENGIKLGESNASASTWVTAAYARIVINEVSSYPSPEWIEIANPTDSSVNIGGWFLYRGNTRIYTFPAGTTLGAFGSGTEYLTVGLTGQLPDTGATISLRRTATEVIDETTYPRMDWGKTWARFKHEDTGRPVDTNASGDFYVSTSPTQTAPNDRKAPNIVVAKVADVAETQPGGIITYTIYYNNTGDGNAKEVWINDTLPDGVTFQSSSVPYTAYDGNTYRWYFATVLHDTQNILTITVRVNDSAGDATQLTNVVNLTYKDQLRRPMPASQSSVSVMCRRALITVEKVVDKSIAGYGEILTYTIYYNNTGTGSAGNVWINDTLPAGADFVYASDGGVLYGNVVRWYFTDVSPGVHYVTMQVLVNITQGVLTNWAYLNYTSTYNVKFAESSASASTTVAELGNPMQIVPVLIAIFCVASRNYFSLFLKRARNKK